MATYWISTGGTDTASGTNFANAKKTVYAGVNLLASKGDILNVVNNGTYTWPTTLLARNGPTGTAWGDPGAIIRGVNTTGSQTIGTDMPIIQSAAGVFNHPIAYMRAGAQYWIIEGIIFDGTPTTDSVSNVQVARMRDGTSGPVRFQYCEFYGATKTGHGSNSQHLNVLAPESTFPAYTGDLYRCYLQNCRVPFDQSSSAATLIVEECVFWNTPDDTSASTKVVFTTAADTVHERSVKQNTMYVSYQGTGAASPTPAAIPVRYGPTTGNAALRCYNNLVYISKESVTGAGIIPNGLVQGNAASTATVNTTNSTIGYNYWALGTDFTTTGSWTGGGIYGKPWSSIATGTGVDDVMSTDVLTQSVTTGEIFGDVTSNYSWVVSSHYTLTVPDLRARVGTTADSTGDQVGALDPFNSPPVANPDVYSVTAGETLNVTAGSGVLANDTDPNLDTLSASLVSDVTTGTLSLRTDGGFTYVSDPYCSGSVTFTYQATDGITWSNITTVTINCSTYETIDPGPDPGDAVTNPVYLDVLPFYEPTLRLNSLARVKTKRNRVLHIDWRDEVEPERWSESTIRRLVLSTNTTQTINMGGVQTAEHLAVQSTTPVRVAVGNSTYFWPGCNFLILAGGNYQTLTLRNDSTTYSATVLVAIVD
ncbi:MAG: hypothetical protein AMJ55_00425 [Gammaproteobacteria bacterium SG8_15]|nr:MAG: hypothetical protein AMJ55_00425 [Gammaproteobacteria bacterium SG8_15]